MYRSRVFRNLLLMVGFVLISFSCVHADDIADFYASIAASPMTTLFSADDYSNNVSRNLAVSTNPSGDISGPDNLK